MVLRKGVLDKRFQKFRRDAKYADALTRTQKEVFGNQLDRERDLEGFHSFMDLIQNEIDGRYQHFIFKIGAKDNPVCPICKRRILGFNLLLEECNDSDIYTKVFEERDLNERVPVQCPKGHCLFYNLKTGILDLREQSKIDKHYEIAKKKGKLPSVWEK